LSQQQRLTALNKFKLGERQILIATDVASRGLDIPAVDLVINFDIPSNSKDYIHRVGRTARAGKSGRAITIVTQYDIEILQKIESLIGKKLEEYKEADNKAALILTDSVVEATRLAMMVSYTNNLSNMYYRSSVKQTTKMAVMMLETTLKRIGTQSSSARRDLMVRCTPKDLATKALLKNDLGNSDENF